MKKVLFSIILHTAYDNRNDGFSFCSAGLIEFVNHPRYSINYIGEVGGLVTKSNLE